MDGSSCCSLEELIQKKARSFAGQTLDGALRSFLEDMIQLTGHPIPAEASLFAFARHYHLMNPDAFPGIDVVEALSLAVMSLSAYLHRKHTVPEDGGMVLQITRDRFVQHCELLGVRDRELAGTMYDGIQQNKLPIGASPASTTQISHIFSVPTQQEGWLHIKELWAPDREPTSACTNACHVPQHVFAGEELQGSKWRRRYLVVNDRGVFVFRSLPLLLVDWEWIGWLPSDNIVVTQPRDEEEVDGANGFVGPGDFQVRGRLVVNRMKWMCQCQTSTFSTENSPPAPGSKDLKDLKDLEAAEATEVAEVAEVAETAADQVLRISDQGLNDDAGTVLLRFRADNAASKMLWVEKILCTLTAAPFRANLRAALNKGGEGGDNESTPPSGARGRRRGRGAVGARARTCRQGDQGGRAEVAGRTVAEGFGSKSQSAAGLCSDGTDHVLYKDCVRGASRDLRSGSGTVWQGRTDGEGHTNHSLLSSLLPQQNSTQTAAGAGTLSLPARESVPAPDEAAIRYREWQAECVKSDVWALFNASVRSNLMPWFHDQVSSYMSRHRKQTGASLQARQARRVQNMLLRFWKESTLVSRHLQLVSMRVERRQLFRKESLQRYVLEGWSVCVWRRRAALTRNGEWKKETTEERCDGTRETGAEETRRQLKVQVWGNAQQNNMVEYGPSHARLASSQFPSVGLGRSESTRASAPVRALSVNRHTHSLSHDRSGHVASARAAAPAIVLSPPLPPRTVSLDCAMGGEEGRRRCMNQKEDEQEEDQAGRVKISRERHGSIMQAIITSPQEPPEQDRVQAGRENCSGVSLRDRLLSTAATTELEGLDRGGLAQHKTFLQPPVEAPKGESRTDCDGESSDYDL